MAERAQMPTANTPRGKSVPLGTTKGHSAILASSGANTANKKGGRSNMPTHNKTNSAPKMGTTKHGVGEVPGYLKGRN